MDGSAVENLLERAMTRLRPMYPEVCDNNAEVGQTLAAQDRLVRAEQVTHVKKTCALCSRRSSAVLYFLISLVISVFTLDG